MKENLKSITLVDQLEEKLLQYIQSSDLKEGDPLPSEFFFAEKYNVSRNLIRESLSRLKMLDVIESRRKRGIVIKESDPMANFVKVVKPNLLSERSILDLIELRCAMEIGIAPMIFRNLTDEDIDELEGIVESETYTDNFRIGPESEARFHSRIYKIANNDVLLSFLNVVVPIFAYTSSHFWEYERFTEELKRANKSVNHKDLLKHLKERNEEGYKVAIEHHLLPYVDYVFLRKKEINYKTK